MTEAGLTLQDAIKEIPETDKYTFITKGGQETWMQVRYILYQNFPTGIRL